MTIRTLFIETSNTSISIWQTLTICRESWETSWLQKFLGIAVSFINDFFNNLMEKSMFFVAAASSLKWRTLFQLLRDRRFRKRVCFKFSLRSNTFEVDPCKFNFGFHCRFGYFRFRCILLYERLFYLLIIDPVATINACVVQKHFSEAVPKVILEIATINCVIREC